MDKKTENIYKNLEVQVDKLFKHSRQGSYKTRERYNAGTKRFCKFLAENFQSKKFANVEDKHIKAYVEYMQTNHLSASTIKTELASIRFAHDMVSQPRCQTLAGNEVYDLEKRSFGGVDRTWTQKEYESMVNKAFATGNSRIGYALQLARNQGVRIHEVFKIDRSMAEYAIKTGELTIKGKGGKIRTVPVTDKTKNIFKNAMQDINRGNKLFVNADEKTHNVIKETQNFIYNHREFCTDRTNGTTITFHGLRHVFAQEKYNEFIQKGNTEYWAREHVSQLLGHERDDVTRIYLNQ